MKARSRLAEAALSAFAALAAAGLAGPAAAQILIGQTAGFSGPVAAGVNETTAGAKLVIDAVNANGGIDGEKIELISLDDAFTPKKAGENARTLITERKVTALFLTRGTPHTQAIMPLLTEFGVPLVGPSTGAMVLHEPVHPWLFNVRATYQREAERAVAHLNLIGVRRIGVIHVKDSFGEDMFTGAQRGFTEAKLEPAFVASFDRAKPDFAAVVAAAAKADPQALLFIGSGTAVADGLKALRAQGVTAQVVTFSNNASGGFVEGLGANARGVIVTQVFPFERSIATGFVKDAMALAKAKNVSLTPAMLEGVAAARVLVAGLRRAPKPVTREGLRRALEGLGKLDLGGLELGYSTSDHTGLDFVDLSIIGSGGKFVR
ncbi:MAG: ABC transporter substrate-binding protein [Burkholderiaceae bacterium]|nr:ABC transporter substrate-binding protein [Burkholderiaceae bacterium]